MIDQKAIAIIGASTGQRILYLKAKEMGLYVIGFAWNKGVLTDNMYDEFHEISVTDIDSIVDICRDNKVKGVVTNASEFLMPFASEIAERLGLTCTPSKTIKSIQNKEYVRKQTEGIEGLSYPKYYLFPNKTFNSFPCVVKPVTGASKKGVCFCETEADLIEAVEYAKSVNNIVLVEEFVPGREFSVETLSYNGVHNIIQITDKQNSGAPHFVELGHHQPSTISEPHIVLIKKCICNILTNINFKNGATHIEMKLDEKTDKLYLIEINCRGGGDHISEKLTYLSTGFDYVKGMIEIAINCFYPIDIKNSINSGIYYLCNQTKENLLFFKNANNQAWLVEKDIDSYILKTSTTNYNRNGYIIYKAAHRISTDVGDADNTITVLNSDPLGKDKALYFISRIQKEGYNSKMNKEWINKIFRYADILVYKISEDIVGWFILYCNDIKTSTAYCAGLHVLPENRRKGIAEMLLKGAIDICRTRRFQKLTLYCNNPIAKELYKKFGFIEISCEPQEQYDGEVYSFMVLYL